MRVLDPLPKIKNADERDSKNGSTSSGVSIMVKVFMFPDCLKDVTCFAGTFFKCLIGLPLYSRKLEMQRFG